MEKLIQYAQTVKKSLQSNNMGRRNYRPISGSDESGTEIKQESIRAPENQI